MLMKKITKILLGTNNSGKLREIRGLLPKRLDIYSTFDFKIKSPAENGKTFKENSLIKAKHFSKKSKMICLSDDSGLEIDALEGDPGIYSARWGGKKGNFVKAMNRVFKELDKKDKNWKTKKIKAEASAQQYYAKRYKEAAAKAETLERNRIGARSYDSSSDSEARAD